MLNEPKAPLILYHADCADGFTSAWVAHRHFMSRKDKIKPDLVRAVYGLDTSEIVLAGRDVYLLDFTYPRKTVEAMAKEARSLTILDHHESAWKEYGEIAPPGSGKEALLHAVGNFHAYFRRDQSGAGMAWMHFNPNMVQVRPSPDPVRRTIEDALMSPLDMDALNLVNYVEDRDLWRFRLPNSREVNAWIFSHEYTLENWDAMARQLNSQEGFAQAVAAGRAIEKKHFKDIEEFLAVSARSMVIGGKSVPCANVPYQWGSDAGHRLLEMHPDAAFAATYWDRADGKRVFGLRSKDDRDNVFEVAKLYGGGGHRNAAGFTARRGWDGDDDEA